MAGFNSPSILFLNTWDKPERDWNGNLFRQAPASGYTRYVELYAGAFANCMVAVENGWKPEQIEACDGLATVEYTRYPEAKGLRGLMKPDRRDRKNGQYQLQYKSDWHDEIGLRNILGQFLAKENRRKQWKQLEISPSNRPAT